MMRAFGDDERGQAIVLLGLAMTGMLVVGGLGIDAGLEYVERRREQVAADAAAYAAAVSMTSNWGAGNRATLARTAALDYAARNGYDNGGTSNTVTVNIPPLTGAFAGNAAYAEVIVSASVRTAFIRILGAAYDSRTISARAVGGVVSPPKQYSLIALNKTACGALTMTGNSEIETDDAGILVNSSCATAFTATGNAEVEADEGGFDIVGGYSSTGGVELEPTPTTGAAQQADPLAYLPRPSDPGFGSIASGSCTQTVGPTIVATGSADCTLNPGTYTSISVSGNGRVKLKAGTYVIKGGGISVTGNGRLEDANVGDGDGVLIFNACAGYPATTGTCGGISVSGSGRFELEETRTGPYAGVSVWQPCENTQTLSVTGSSSGTGSHDFETEGAVYLPCAAVAVTGNGKLEIDEGQLIADTISVTGNAEIEVEWEASSPSAARRPALVE